MIVRESPNAKASRSKDDAAWPPRSPYQALLSSPSGKRKLERRRECLSPSPSPSKYSSLRTTQEKSPSRALHLGEEAEEEVEEDEETLQLELQAIEARLKLKRLQQAKARQQETSSEQREELNRRSPVRQRERTPPARSRDGNNTIQVPVSPNQDRSRQVQRSPARVMLGIDKGLRAESVSLKRATSASNLRSRFDAAGSHQQRPPGPPKKSFSERIAESRSSDRERQEKQDRLKKSRNQGFNIQADGHETLRSATNPSRLTQKGQRPRNDSPIPAAGLESNSLQNGSQSTASSSLRRSKSVSNSADALKQQQRSNRKLQDTSSENRQTPEDPVSESITDEANVFEPYSGFHLSKRLITHNVLTRALEGKETFTIPRLFKTVRSPHYDPPDTEADYVVFAIIASKSSPYNHRSAHKVVSSGDPDDSSAARAKFMVLRLTDLKWEIDLYLFDSGLDTFWKLTVGTVVAILNPGIMPPKNRDMGAFSLKVSSSEDTVLEVGKARDLGFCKSVRKDGKKCESWVDRRSTEYCEFHVSMLLEKTKAGRMEVNGMSGAGKGRGRGGKSEPRGGRGWGGSWRGGGGSREPARQGEWHNRYLHETMYIAPKESAARLLDLEDTNNARDKAEALRKRKAEIDRETELAKKLASAGSGTGKEYLQSRHAEVVKENVPTSQSSTSTIGTTEPPDAASLGLLGNKASEITLSPVKRGRSLVKEGSNPLGWGGASKRGLLDLQPKQASTERERSPSKKKARFMLDQGIRQPGRESFGNPGQASGGDDEDELEIV
ncbi:MAG: hypothetical protein Q9165_004397 [Trypethelium subeluteriae]